MVKQMGDEMIKNLEKFLEPIEKLVTLNTNHFDKLIEAQKLAAENYANVTKQRMSAASQINDPEALARFVTDQMALAQSSYENMVSNSRTLFETMTGYNAEVIKLFQDSTKDIRAEVQKAIEESRK